MLFCVVINIYTGWQKLLVWSLCNRCGCVDRFFMGSLHAFLYIFYFFASTARPPLLQAVAAMPIKFSCKYNKK